MKIFLSFTHLLGPLAEGKVLDRDLKSGLFAFSCSRKHAMETPWSGTEMFWVAGNAPHECPEEDAPLLLGVLRRMVSAAEDSGRVAWRPEEAEGMTYEQVTNLLKVNGLIPPPPPEGEYTYPAARKWLARVKGLEVA